MTGHGVVYSKIPLIIKIRKTEAFERLFALLLFRIEVV